MFWYRKGLHDFLSSRCALDSRQQPVAGELGKLADTTISHPQAYIYIHSSAQLVPLLFIVIIIIWSGAEAASSAAARRAKRLALTIKLEPKMG